MATIIDSTYFQKGKLFIPGSVQQPSVSGNAPTDIENITSYVERYESELMSYAIGHLNYKALQSALVADPDLSESFNAIWKDLLDGKHYQIGTKWYCWPGLRRVNGSIKSSLVANYVFCKYFEDNQQQYTSTGMQRPNADNATMGSANLKLTQVWRDFIEQYQGGIEGANHPRIVYNSSGGVGLDWFSQNNAPIVSLYRFLDEYSTIPKTNFTFQVFDNRNLLGL